MTERRPILMLCIGGQQTSLLAKSLYLCGMSLGNDITGWKQSDYGSHTEHAEITNMMAVYNTLVPNLEEQKKVVDRLIEILTAYRTQAEIHNWKYYGIKTTSGICTNKWDVIKSTYYEQWPDALYFSLLRRPVLCDGGVNEGWGNVYRARRELAETRNGVFLPYPEVYMTGEIRKFIAAIGLSWNDEVMELHESKRYKEGVRGISDDQMDREYEHLMDLSQRNFYNLFGETLELRGV